jgi:hypothetical protein
MKALIILIACIPLTACLATQPLAQPAEDKVYPSRSIETLCKKGALRPHNYRCFGETK